MKIKTLLSSLLLFTALGTVLITTSSNSGGFTGNNANCQGCHGTDANTIVTINGLPASGGYTPGSTYPITVTVTNAAQVAAGFDIQTTAGNFSNPGAGVIVNGATTGAGHTGGAKAMVGGTATFNLDWQAPSSGSATASFTAEGNAVNLNGATSGDGANFASNVLVPLPVHFVSFNVNSVNNNAQVIFETENEENIKHFDVERSVDGIHCENIHTLSAKGDGSYKFTDKTIASNMKYFFRIKEVDIDNGSTYSEVRSIVINKASNDVVLYPSQVNNQVIKINGLDSYEGLQLEVYSLFGMRAATINSQSNQFYLNDISTGSYIVRLIRGNKILKVQKITVVQ